MCGYEMNEYQRSIMNIEKTYPNTSVCYIGGIMEFQDGTDIELMLRAVNIFIRQNPMIRLRIGKDERLYIDSHISETEVCSYTDVHDKELLVQQLMAEPIALYDSPLYVFKYIKIAAGEFGFMKIHHILGDHAALLAFFKELEKIYFSLKEGSEVKEKYDTRYLDTMLAGAIDISPEAKEYYKLQFEKYGYVPGKRLSSAAAGLYIRSLKYEDADKILSFCKENKIKLESVFYAALAVYEAKTKNRDTAVIGRVLMNRWRGQLDVFGLYVNTLPLFINTTGSFLEICRTTDAAIEKSTLFSAYPLNCVLADHGIRERCFDIELSFISMGMMPRFKMGIVKKYFNGSIELPMRIHVIRHKSRLDINIEFAAELFSAEYICAFTDSLINIIVSGIGSRAGGLLSPEDEEAYRRLNDVRHIKADTTVSRIFSMYAAAHCDEVAVIYDGRQFTFSQTERMANRIAALCRGEKIVGIAEGRCEYLIPAMLGVLKAGAAYMPLNPMLAVPDECDMVLSLSKYAVDGAVLLDRLDDMDVEPIDLSVPENAAYYMKTSGSTGAPKTVIISNRSLYLRLRWMHEKYRLDGRILQKTNATFDVSGWELLCGAFGGCAVLMKDGEEKNCEKIAEYIREYGIDTIHFVPSMLRIFLEYIGAGSLPSLKKLFSSGEALDAQTVRRALKKLPGAGIYNLYGPTECTIDVTSYACRGDETEIPIGRPVYNTGIYIVNKEAEIMPRGIEGEILVTGSLVGMGYREGGGGYTEFNGLPSYRTGDMGVLGFDGNIYYKGRRDSQVKVNGKRIDLMQLEKLILDIDGVTGSAAVFDSGRIRAYYSAAEPIKDITAYLAKKTDRLPSAVVYLKNLPVTETGKADRSALIKMKIESQRVPPADKIEEAILSAAAAELDDSVTIGVTDNFFDAGLDSLSVLSLSLRLGKKGFEFTAQDIYANPTVRSLAVLQNKPRMLIRLNNVRSDRVLCCFPYAGGAPQTFRKIAEETECTVLGVNYDFFDNGSSVDEIAEKTAAELKSYKSISLAAVCLGSAFALETAAALERNGFAAEHIYISASLPIRTPRGINPWRAMPAKNISAVLSDSLGRGLPEGFLTDVFLRDSDRYFKYTASNFPLLSSAAYIAFADGDSFTKGYKKKMKKWNRYFKSKITFSVFNTNNHYFMTDTDGILSLMEGGISE